MPILAHETKRAEINYELRGGDETYLLVQKRRRREATPP
jgi:hypothetical protein